MIMYRADQELGGSLEVSDSTLAGRGYPQVSQIIDLDSVPGNTV